MVEEEEEKGKGKMGKQSKRLSKAYSMSLMLLGKRLRFKILSELEFSVPSYKIEKTNRTFRMIAHLSSFHLFYVEEERNIRSLSCEFIVK